jgi:hypothetical protein
MILGYPEGMRAIIVTLLAGLTAGCAVTTSYWQRPGATLSDVATDSESCYQTSLDFESPSAFPSGNGARLLPRTTPPPRLWARPPRQAALERFDEQMRYEHCMRDRGWLPAGSAPLRRS